MPRERRLRTQLRSGPRTIPHLEKPISTPRTARQAAASALRRSVATDRRGPHLRVPLPHQLDDPVAPDRHRGVRDGGDGPPEPGGPAVRAQRSVRRHRRKVARHSGRTTPLGAFWDGTVDRFVDALVIAVFFFVPFDQPRRQIDVLLFVLLFATLLPPFVVAYANHRGAVPDPTETVIHRWAFSA